MCVLGKAQRGPLHAVAQATEASKVTLPLDSISSAKKCQEKSRCRSHSGKKRHVLEEVDVQLNQVERGRISNLAWNGMNGGTEASGLSGAKCASHLSGPSPAPGGAPPWAIYYSSPHHTIFLRPPTINCHSACPPSGSTISSQISQLTSLSNLIWVEGGPWGSAFLPVHLLAALPTSACVTSRRRWRAEEAGAAPAGDRR
ncbi:hypothetical protein H1C71_006012 [Ictidomys tridecemlineatus]|nr:hypothetical protein H1C71_006012 [Ictidomys tridecemlineatus]